MTTVIPEDKDTPWQETLADFLFVDKAGAPEEVKAAALASQFTQALDAMNSRTASVQSVRGVLIPDSGETPAKAPLPDGKMGHDHGHHDHGHDEDGHDHHHGHSHEDEDWRLLAVLAGGCALFLVFGWLSPHFGAPTWLTLVFFVGSMVLGGWDAFVDSLGNIPRGKLDIHFLMLAVAIGAACIGAWSEGALLLFLFSASGALEAFAMNRTKRAIDSLFKNQPKTALVVRDGGEPQTTPVEDVRAGDIIFVRPGDVFPVDGEIFEGETSADESSMTGEALPASKQKGDNTFGGTVNLWGAVKIRVSRPASESSLQKIIRLIQDAQKQKAPSQRFTDKFGTRYTVLILGLTALMFFVWWLGFGLAPFANTSEQSSAFYRAMTLLVVASPCALVLSIPSAILAAIAWGARHGILFRGGAAVEKLAEVDYVALDKTGTLTTGELAVAKLESFPTGRENDVLRLAVSLESNATHPLARAIVTYGKYHDVEKSPVSGFQNMVGQGVKGNVDNIPCVLGRRELFEGGPLADWAAKVPAPPADHTEIWVISKDVVGRILMRDQIRQESKPAMDELGQLGIRTVMLTGDRREAAHGVGEQLGIQDIRAGLTPAGKVDFITKLGKEGHHVAMVGDGVNDAPSLAAAYVAVGMGARGADAALEQCDVVLMNDRINLFLDARKLSVRARRIIKQNLTISLGTILIMVLASIGIGIPLYLGVFAHEGSTVIVCFNSLRLLFGKNPAKKPVDSLE
ncbi:MAG: cation-translocating P-type ATPase [Puniceicoccales bacterium]|jgi:Cd2+/Zn2+-exporting ATPase|nr:cation-translocating P-type ATPase [Puniceicoccales bacterium]